MGKLIRIPRKFKEFTYDGVKFAMRVPTTKEQEDITRKMADYQRTIREQIKADVGDGIFEQNNQQGDLAVLISLQVYIARMLVVDYETHTQLFIGDNAIENIDEAPGEFVTEAWKCYTGQNARTYKARDLEDIFGSEFCKDYAIIPADVLDLQLRRLDLEEPEKAHKARVALDLVKPGEPQAKNKSSADVTTTSSFEDKSSE